MKKMEKYLLMPTKPPSGNHSDWIKNLITMIIALGIGLAGFHLLDDAKSWLWLMFFVLAMPIILVAVQSAQTIREKAFLDMYKIGVSQIPFVGKALLKLFKR